MELGGDDFYLDLLFYYLKLHCYVVVELKAGKFDTLFLLQINRCQISPANHQR